MGLTTSSDLVVPEILAEAISAAFAGMNVLNGTGAAVVSNTLPGNVKGGKKITVPYFDALGEMDDVPEGDALTPETLTMSDEEAVVIHSGKAVELTQWARLAAEYADPYSEVARQFTELMVRRADKALLDAAFASLPQSNIHNATSSTLGYDEIVNARLKWGDEQDGIAMLGVHSKVYGDLMKERTGTGVDGNGDPIKGAPLLVDPRDGSLPRAAGIPVRVSDKNSVSAGSPPHYTSILVKRGALALWYQSTPKVYFAKDPLADTDVIAMHVYFVAHRYKRIRGAGTLPGVVKIVTL